MNRPGHDLDPTRRFSDRTQDYVRFRPTYPPRAIDHILAGLVDPHQLIAADVGAGTGISARLLADRGVRVLAIEPNAEMRAAAEPNPNVSWLDGTAESTGLPEASVDLVLCAQSFHWFRAREAAVEFHRVLRPHGRLAVVWNRRDREDPFARGYIEAIHEVNGEHPAERREFDPDVIRADGRFEPPGMESFSNRQTLDRAGLMGRARSASYVPKDGADWERLSRLLNQLYERHRDDRDQVTLRYRTEVWTTTAREREARS